MSEWVAVDEIPAAMRSRKYNEMADKAINDFINSKDEIVCRTYYDGIVCDHEKDKEIAADVMALRADANGHGIKVYKRIGKVYLSKENQ